MSTVTNMMYPHRHGDTRTCGATTVVVNQDFVFVEGKLWAVDGDPNSHSAGGLIPTISYITINGLRVIKNLDSADPDIKCFIDGPPHCNPYSVGYSDLMPLEVA